MELHVVWGALPVAAPLSRGPQGLRRFLWQVSDHQPSQQQLQGLQTLGPGCLPAQEVHYSGPAGPHGRARKETPGAPREGTCTSASGEASKPKSSAPPRRLFLSTKSVLAGSACIHPGRPGTHHPPTTGARRRQSVCQKPVRMCGGLASASFFRRPSPSPKDRTGWRDTVSLYHWSAPSAPS